MSQVDEVRSAADIVRIVGDYVRLRKAGANFMGLCPFHQEKTPSFAVHPTKQIFHCFGCGVGGDVFKFVMLIENLSFPEALRRVAEKVGVKLRETPGGAELDERARERAALYKIHEEATKFYAAQLGGTTEGRAARAYLADRGLSDEVVGRFRIGYAPSEGQRLTRHLQEAGFSPEISEKSGLVLRDAEGKRHYDRFRRRILFPIARETGRVVAFGGRALGDDQPKYLNSPETPIYTKSRVLYNLERAGQAIRRSDQAILVEGYMDCIAVVSAGIENVVASCGTSLTDKQTRLLSRYSRRVVMNYDPDSAGVAATERSLNLLLEEGFEARVLALPGGLDPDAFIRREGSSEYQRRLLATPSYIDFLTDRAIAQHGAATPEAKAAVANYLIPYLAKVPNAMLRGTLANKLVERLQITDRQVREQVMRAVGQRQIFTLPAGALASKVTLAERELLRAILESEELADEILPRLVESGDCEGLALEGIFKRLLQVRRGGESIELARLGEWFSDEDQRAVFETVFLAGLTPERERAFACLRALQRKRMEGESQKLKSAIEAAIREQDFQKLAELQSAKSKLDKELRAARRA